ncbi:MAG TPA: response regulator [Marinobacterium sp.]|nr:response regulator [Marinobacterium sp.]
MTSDIQEERPLNGLNLVCADDEPIALTILAEILTAAGAIVRTAKNGAQAIELIHKHPTDAVLLDIQMPVMDGLTAIQILRGEGFDKQIIAVTAASKHEAQAILDSGADEYISKPVLAADLVAIIQQGRTA